MREFERLAPRPSRGEVPASEHDDYDSVIERTSRIHGFEGIPARYFGALLNSPPLAAGIVNMGRLVREGEVRGSYTDAERELVDMVYARDLGYNGHLPLHIPDAIACGVRLEAIEAILHGHEEDLTDEERDVAAYARAVANGTVTAEAGAARSSSRSSAASW